MENIDLVSVLKSLNVLYAFALAVFGFACARHLANHKEQDDLRKMTSGAFFTFGCVMLAVVSLVALMSSLKQVLPPKNQERKECAVQHQQGQQANSKNEGRSEANNDGNSHR